MVAPNTSRLSQFNSLVTTTIENMAPEIIDNISQHIPFFNKIYKQGNIKKDGGTQIVVPLEYTNNTTYSRISGADKFDTSATDPFSAATYEYKQVVVSITTNDDELWKNSGKEKMIDLAAAKGKNAMRAIKEGLDEDLYSDGTASAGKQIGGLDYLIPVDPTASSTIGGINQSTWEFWRSVTKYSVTDFSAALSASNITAHIRKMKHNLSRSEGKPDFALCDNDFWDYLALALEDRGRYAGDKDSIDAGFESLKYCNIDFLNAEEADGNITENYTYFLNSNSMKFVIHKDRDMVPLEGERTVNDQAVIIKPITFVGNLIATSRREHGLYIDGSAS